MKDLKLGSQIKLSPLGTRPKILKIIIRPSYITVPTTTTTPHHQYILVISTSTITIRLQSIPSKMSTEKRTVVSLRQSSSGKILLQFQNDCLSHNLKSSPSRLICRELMLAYLQPSTSLSWPLRFVITSCSTSFSMKVGSFQPSKEPRTTSVLRSSDQRRRRMSQIHSLRWSAAVAIFVSQTLVLSRTR